MEDALQKSRAEIDRLDAAMTALFEERMAVVTEISAWKQAQGLPITDPAREQAVLSRNAARLRDPALAPYLEALLDRLMAVSRDYQRTLSVDPEAEGLRIRTSRGLCPVVLEPGLLVRAAGLLDLNRRVFVVTDSGVPAAYARTLAAQCADPTVYIVPQGEGSKTPAVWQALLTAMLEAGLTRQDCVVALGGGMVGDLAGFAAASYMRGIDFYNVPTTVLAMVDSAVGGKTALDLAGVKNAVGAFWPPRAVLIDPELLKTLPVRHRANGLAEALKMGLTSDPALFALLEDLGDRDSLEPVIRRALRVKQKVVEADEREAGLRRILNFGHTLGHGIESAAKVGLLHGECVALGMIPLCAPAVRSRLIPVLKRLGLPVRAAFDPEIALAAIAHDKKTDTAGITVVTVPEIGQRQFETWSLSRLREALMTVQAEVAE